MATYLCRELGYEDCEFLFNPEENNPEKIVKHFTVAHGLVIKSGGEVITKDDGIKNREQKLFGAPFILKHGVSRNPFRTSFVIVATRHPVKNTVSWHFIFIGDTTHQKSSDFVLQLRVKSVSKEVNDLRWRIPSISAVEMVEAIKVGYFSIPLDILEEHYISSENSLQTSFIVQRVTSPEMKIGLEPTLWKIQIPWKNPWKYLSVDITEKKTDDSKIDTRIDEPTPEPVTCNKEYSSADATSEKKSDETKINDQPFCEPEFPPEPVKFNKTTCSSCGITPLQVKFYKCLQCSNITLCQNCHAKKIHSGHVFAIIQSLEQEEATRNKHILSKQLDKSYHATLLPPVCNGIVMKTQETKIRCRSSRVRYICLECQYFFLCEICMYMETHNLKEASSSARGHNSNHIFAMADSDGQRKLIKGHLIYKYPIL